MSELDQLRQEAEQLKSQIRVYFIYYKKGTDRLIVTELNVNPSAFAF